VADVDPVSPIGAFVDAVRAAEVDADAARIAEMLWLAERLPKGAAQSRQPPADPLPPPVASGSRGQHGHGGEGSKRRRSDNEPGSGQAEGTSAHGVYAKEGRSSGLAGAAGIRVAGARALPQSLDLERALRPLRRRRPSHTTFVLDVERTAQQSAESDMLVPVMRAEGERWFGVALVADGTPSLAIWRETLAELNRLLERHAAFSDVRRWTLRAQDDIVLQAESGLIQDARILADPRARRLILIATDGVAAHWHDARTWRTIAAWARTTPTAFLQLLPESLWPSTAVGEPSARASSLLPGVPNAALRIERAWWDPCAGGIGFPVMSLAPGSVSAWANVVMGASGNVPVTMGPSNGAYEQSAGGAVPDTRTALSAKERVRRFQSLVSPTAYRLAVYLSATPLNLPVMRLVQYAMLPASEHAHLAEFVLGGLIARAPDASDSFVFHDGVRELLQESLLRSELDAVLRTLSTYIAVNFGSPVDFAALIADPSGSERLPTQAIPFATIATELLGRFTLSPAELPQLKVRPGTPTGTGSAPIATREAAVLATRPRVQIAGTGVGKLSQRHSTLAEQVGRHLVHAGVDLATGGWPGVDHAVAKAFVSESHRSQTKLRLIEYREIEYREAQSFLAEPITEAETVVVSGDGVFDIPADECDAAILIGGRGATGHIANTFLRAGKPVLPINASGGDAAYVYKQMVRYSRERRIVDLFALRTLSQTTLRPVNAAESIASNAVALVEALLIPKAIAAYVVVGRWTLNVLGRLEILHQRQVPHDVSIFLGELAEMVLPNASLERGDHRPDLSPYLSAATAIYADTASLLVDPQRSGRWLTRIYLRLEQLQRLWMSAQTIQRAIVRELEDVDSLQDLLGSGVGLNATEAALAAASLDRLSTRSRRVVIKASAADAPTSIFGAVSPAATQDDLDVPTATLSERASTMMSLEDAVTTHRNTLLLRTRERAPLDWAATQNSLGVALAAIGERELGTAHLEEAILAYRDALLERTRERVPLDWAATQNNLGVALAAIGQRELGTTHLEEALAAYRKALLERTRDQLPLGWAATENNLGLALAALGEREVGTSHLEEAIVAYRSALLEFTRDSMPLGWAVVHNNLGLALTSLGKRESETVHLEEAVMAYRNALLERTRDLVPLGWAATQNNLGLALATLGEREAGTSHLEEAVLAYRNALLERTRGRVPLEWAATQNNLGLALAALGRRESETGHLKEGVAAYRAALLERTRDRVPLDWAATVNNLGRALAALGERESETAYIEEAIIAYRNALLELTRDRVPLEWAETQNNLGLALAALGERKPGTTHLEAAVTAYRAALLERTRDRLPLDWTVTQNYLATVLKALDTKRRALQGDTESLGSYPDDHSAS
jgi:tetratricopeptide (TPR) repeat protein